MHGVFKKLNLKDQPEILVVNAPVGFEPQLDTLSGVRIVRNPLKIKRIFF